MVDFPDINEFFTVYYIWGKYFPFKKCVINLKSKWLNCFNFSYEIESSRECNTLELESTIQTCWDPIGVSLKPTEITKPGTVCAVQQHGDDFTTFVICTSRGWSSTQNEGWYKWSVFLWFNVKLNVENIKFQIIEASQCLLLFCFYLFDWFFLH